MRNGAGICMAAESIPVSRPSVVHGRVGVRPNSLRSACDRLERQANMRRLHAYEGDYNRDECSLAAEGVSRRSSGVEGEQSTRSVVGLKFAIREMDEVT